MTIFAAKLIEDGLESLERTAVVGWFLWREVVEENGRCWLGVVVQGVGENGQDNCQLLMVNAQLSMGRVGFNRQSLV